MSKQKIKVREERLRMRAVKTILIVPTDNSGGEKWIRDRLNEAGFDQAESFWTATLIVLPGGAKFLDRVPQEFRCKTVVIYTTDPSQEEPTRANYVLAIKNNGFRDIYLGHLNADALVRWVVTHLNGRFPKSSL